MQGSFAEYRLFYKAQTCDLIDPTNQNHPIMQTRSALSCKYCENERSMIQCAAEGCSMVQCVELYCSSLLHGAVCCSVLQCVAVCCSVLQCVVHCIQCVAYCVQCVARCVQCVSHCVQCVTLVPLALLSLSLLQLERLRRASEQCVAVCCCVLQCAAVCYSVLQ